MFVTYTHIYKLSVAVLVPFGHISSRIHFFQSLIFKILTNAKSLLEN